MREILFRGKETFNGEWVEGYYEFGYDAETEEPTHYMWVLNHTEKYSDMFMVIPETVGQYTGLTDRNGKKIFEGDIVKAQDNLITSPFCDGIIGKIVYDECAYFIEPKNPMDSQRLFNECAEYEVIGNIHDNPELLT
jgi:uncharacterized phage protein (TIGR01671 family)